MNNIDLTRLNELRNAHPDLLCVDIRSREERDRFSIDNFKHIPFELLDVYFSERKFRSDHMVILCEDGERSIYAANMIQKMIPEVNIFVLENGISDFE